MLWWNLRKLNSRDAATRRVTVERLGRERERRAVLPLIDCLHDPENRVREAAVKALARIGDRRAIDPLARTAGDRNQDVAKEAIRALGSMQALEPLLALLAGDLDYEVFNALREADPHWRTSAPARSAVAVLVAGLKSHDPARRGSAALALGEIGDAAAADALIAGLSDRDQNVRGWSARSLGKIRDARAVAPLVRALKDPSTLPDAIASLGQLGDPSATGPLLEVLKTVSGAVEALGLCGDERAVNPLIDCLLNPEPAGEHRNDPNSIYYERARRSGPVQALERILERVPTRIAIADLRRLCTLRDFIVEVSVQYNTPGYGDGTDHHAAEVSLANVRQAAVEELRRRGTQP